LSVPDEPGTLVTLVKWKWSMMPLRNAQIDLMGWFNGQLCSIDNINMASAST